MISSVSRLCSLWIPTGMPRPLSSTVTELSAWIVIAHVVRVTHLGLVDRVVDELEDHVVQPREIVRVPDVHAGALADGLQALQQLDGIGGVGRAHEAPFTARTRTSAAEEKCPCGAAARTLPRCISRTAAGRFDAPTPNRAGGAVVVSSTWASAGSASKNSSTQLSDRPASKSSAANSGGSPADFATALHSASFTRATVRATSPEDASAASGRPSRVQSRSSRCGPASEYPRRRSRGSSRWQAARSSSTESPGDRILGAHAAIGLAGLARQKLEFFVPEAQRRAPMPAHRRSGDRKLLRPGLELARSRRVSSGARPARAREQRVALPQGRAVAREIVSGRRLQTEHESIQEPTPRRRRAEEQLAMFGGEEHRRRQAGNLAEPGRLLAAPELPAFGARPGHGDPFRARGRLERPGDRKGFALARHRRRRRPAKGALPAHEGRSLEEVRFALRVLSRDQRDPRAKKHGVGGEVAEALVRDLGKLQAV